MLSCILCLLSSCHNAYQSICGFNSLSMWYISIICVILNVNLGTFINLLFIIFYFLHTVAWNLSLSCLKKKIRRRQTTHFEIGPSGFTTTHLLCPLYRSLFRPRGTLFTSSSSLCCSLKFISSRNFFLLLFIYDFMIMNLK